MAASIVMAGLLARRDLELKRIARMLDGRRPAGNARVTLSVRSGGLIDLARAVNRELDEEMGRRIEDERERQAAREGLAALSHDIRTPLAGARGYLQLAVQEEDDAARARYMDAAANRLDAMRNLVDGLLEYARASDGSSPLELEGVDIASALSDALMGLYPRFVECGREPDVEMGEERLSVLADRKALGRVFSNLLANSLHHGSSAPCIAVKGDDGMVEIIVSNKVSDPFSIDPERLFDRFYKAGVSRGTDGSGLGLAIVARLCERMGGFARAELEGDVLKISVSLPRAPRE